MTQERTLDWLDRRRGDCGLACSPVPLRGTRRWGFVDGTIRHASGRFFSVLGIRVSSNRPELDGLAQPIIRQPEMGLLGLLARRTREGVPQFLLQARTEPGNVDDVQLAPTVQAAESNYTRVHGGAPTPYLDLFRKPCETVSDSLQSELGTRFLGKYNRNACVALPEGAAGPDPASDAWRWCDADELLAALPLDYRVNTDLRSALACTDWRLLCGSGEPFSRWRGRGGFDEALLDSFEDEAGEACTAEVASRLEAARRSIVLGMAPCPVGHIPGWNFCGDRIVDAEERRFEVGGFRIEAADREVTAWDQPLIRDLGTGEVTLLCQRREGLLRFLLRTRVEPGFREKALLGPSVRQFYSVSDAPPGRPAHPDPLAGAAESGVVRMQCWLSDKGGRLRKSSTLYRVVEMPEDETVGDDPESHWLSLDGLRRLVSRPGCLTSEARSTIALLLSRA